MAHGAGDCSGSFVGFAVRVCDRETGLPADAPTAPTVGDIADPDLLQDIRTFQAATQDSVNTTH